MRNDASFRHVGCAAAQIELMYELGLRREESAKLDLPNDWDRENHSLLIPYGTKGGRPGILYDLTLHQEADLGRAEEYVTPSNRKGINNLMPEHMGDEWLHRLDYAARKHGLTGKDAGGTQHGLRHERFRQMYVGHTGFEPPNRHESVQAFQKAVNNQPDGCLPLLVQVVKSPYSPRKSWLTLEMTLGRHVNSQNMREYLSNIYGYSTPRVELTSIEKIR